MTLAADFFKNNSFKNHATAKNSWFKSIWLRWLDKRIPPSQCVQLSQRQIFILPTRYGWISVGVLLVLFIGGINYANSLVLGTTFWLLAIFLVSIFHTYRNLAGLTISASRVQSCCAGELAGFYITLSRPEQQEHQALMLTWAGVQKMTELIHQSLTTLCMPLPTRHRGLFQPGRLKIASCFPLGLFRAWTWVDLDMMCWVYPQPVPSLLPNLLPAVSELTDAQLHNRVMGVDDFECLQTYTPGDPLKHVHWKVFARTDEMFTKTFVAAHQPQRLLDWTQMPSDHLEIKLSQLCYWVLKFAEQQTSFALQLPGKKIALGTGDAHCQRCLLALAQI
jgi:uncharacterized protein (DUF58 family)